MNRSGMALGIGAVALLAGCPGGAAQDLVVENGEIPGTAKITFTSSKAGTPTVKAQLGEDGDILSTPAGAEGTEHALTMLGLKTGRTYTVWVELDVDGKVRTSDEVELVVNPPPVGVPSFTLGEGDSSLSCAEGGYFLFSYLDSNASGVGIIDRDGAYVWAWNDVPDGLSIGRARAGRDGRSIHWNYADEGRVDDLGANVRMSIDGSESCTTRTEWSHHDFVEPEVGELAWNAYEFEEDLDVGGKPLDTAVDAIYDGPLCADDATDTQYLWTMLDPEQWPHGFWNSGNVNQFLPGWHEFSHGNSLAYVEADDSYLAMFRWIDTVVKVDRQSGDRLWTLGGRGNEFTPAAGTVEDDLFLQSHFSDAWDDQILVFDNRPRPDNSRLAQFTIDEENMTYSRDWFLQLDSRENLLGDVRRMPVEGCDNLAVALSTQGRILEMTRDGDVAWSAGLALGAAVTRITYLPDLYDFTGVEYQP
ncbi:MAG: aryl-sulfate sulfotransferase [Myxococcales bacterium]|nr:aryl-sulfate sulfotransferase [Myxococcales bacterium]